MGFLDRLKSVISFNKSTFTGPLSLITTKEQSKPFFESPFAYETKTRWAPPILKSGKTKSIFILRNPLRTCQKSENKKKEWPEKLWWKTITREQIYKN